MGFRVEDCLCDQACQDCFGWGVLVVSAGFSGLGDSRESHVGPAHVFRHRPWWKGC